MGHRILAGPLALLGFAIAVGAAHARPAGPVPVPHRGDISAAAWLAGCWELQVGARVSHEHWMAPAGGAMLGMSRTIVRDTLREYEFLRIAPVEGRLTYVAVPSGQRETAFAATALTDTLLVFENPAHDFPQRILYRRIGADSLVARIEGTRGGQARGIDFPMRRTGCDGQQKSPVSSTRSQSNPHRHGENTPGPTTTHSQPVTRSSPEP
jgi:hypothetical protein